MDRVGACMSYINHECTPSADKVLKVWDHSGHQHVSVVFEKSNCNFLYCVYSSCIVMSCEPVQNTVEVIG